MIRQRKMDINRESTSIAEKILSYLLLILSAAFVIVFFIIAIKRLSYPFELEWMEGGSVDHVARVMKGLPIYCKPTLDFTPFRYAPLYYYISAGLASITGLGFIPLRLVSILSTVGCFTVIYKLLRNETNNRLMAVMGVGLFAATFPLGGSWFDLARVDMLFLFLLLCSIYVMRFYSSLSATIVAGILIWLSFITKQSALIILAPLVLYYIVRQKRKGIIFAGTILGCVLISTLIFQATSDGWYNFYIFKMGAQQHIIGKGLESFKRFFVLDLYKNLSIFVLLLIYYIIHCLKNIRNRVEAFYLLAILGVTVGTYMSRANAGGWTNTLLPIHALIAVITVLAVHRIIIDASSLKKGMSKTIPIFIYTLLLIQFTSMIYSPSPHIPTMADREAGMEFISKMRAFQGDILVPYHSYIPTMAGKKSYANHISIQDVLSRSSGAPREELAAEIRQSIAQKRFDAIIIDRPWFQNDLEIHYRKSDMVFKDNSVFLPVAGWQIRPEAVYVPR